MGAGSSPGENPFVVEPGGFYRRWLSMIDDLGELRATVARLEDTTEDQWVPVWQERGRYHEDAGDRLHESGAREGARREFLQAKTYYAIGRFPGEITAVKARISADCRRAYLKACRYLDPPLEIVHISCGAQVITAHFRAPREARPESPVPVVLVLCGGDVFKEDRGWAAEMALDTGLAALVMDGPATGENPLPHEPESVKAGLAAIEYLSSRPEIDDQRIGGFGISRGGHSVLQLAGAYPDRVGAVVAIAGHPLGYRMSEEELKEYVEVRNNRAMYRFGDRDGPPSFAPTSVERERAEFTKWALSELGVLDGIRQPVLMINGKLDHLAPIGNIYFMLEHGPPTGREARIYPDAGHCAFEYFDEWAPASFAWLGEKLTA